MGLEEGSRRKVVDCAMFQMMKQRPPFPELLC